MGPGEEPGIVPGTLEFTTSTGLRYRRTPTRTTPTAPDLEVPLIATAVAHAHLRAAQTAADDARVEIRTRSMPGTSRHDALPMGETSDSEFDGEDRSWRRSQTDRTRQRIVNAADRPPGSHDVPRGAAVLNSGRAQLRASRHGLTRRRVTRPNQAASSVRARRRDMSNSAEITQPAPATVPSQSGPPDAASPHVVAGSAG